MTEMFGGGCITLDNYLLINPDVAFQIANDLYFTTSRSLSGRMGNVAHININNDIDWAENLYDLLTLFNANGLQLVLHEMGNPWGTALGLLAPYYNYQPVSAFGATATTIAAGLLMIDKLGGDNNLGHNFFTDSRMPYWTVINEANIDLAEVPAWTAPMADSIRSYGGKVTGTLRDTSHRYAEAFPYIMPFAEAHFNLLQAHEYLYYMIVSQIRNEGANADIYQPIYDRGVAMFGSMLDTRGPFSVDQVVLGEWGFWHGTMQGPGLTEPLTVTHHQHAEYIRAAFDAMIDVGLKNQYYHLIFDNPVEFWGIVNEQGVPYTEEYDNFKSGMSKIVPPSIITSRFPLVELISGLTILGISNYKK